MFTVGLTGGIGSGKTTVANVFAQLGVPIIDADVLARDVVQVGQPAWLEIARIFGSAVLNPDGSLNRAVLREFIFSNTAAKQTLEAIVHPLIYQAIQSAIAQLHAEYCIVCVPLLLEANWTALVNRILVVDCPVATQIMRVKQRDHLSLAQIQAIMASQIARDVRLARADDVIDNSETDDKLAEAVKKLHNLYLSISQCQD